MVSGFLQIILCEWPDGPMVTWGGGNGHAWLFSILPSNGVVTAVIRTSYHYFYVIGGVS